jgi:hypothetical protein
MIAFYQKFSAIKPLQDLVGLLAFSYRKIPKNDYIVIAPHPRIPLSYHIFIHLYHAAKATPVHLSVQDFMEEM